MNTVKRMLISLLLLASVFALVMYATDSWIFAFAPAKVDELTIVYQQTRERAKLSPEQTAVVLVELRDAPAYPTIIDLASQRDQYPASHQLVTLEGDKRRVYCVFLEHDLVSDSDYQNLRLLGQQTKDLIALLKPSLPGEVDIVVPDYVTSTAGNPIPYTRYILPVAYGSPDFRVYTTGSWEVDWGTQAMVLAAWGERPSGGYGLQIKNVATVDDWLRVTVGYFGPEQEDPGSPPSCPADAALIDRNLLSGLIGVCFVDQESNLFSSQALGSYPVERQFELWPKTTSLPVALPTEGSGVVTSMVGDSQVQTLVIYYDYKAASQPVISSIVEASRGNFIVYIAYEPGTVRHCTAVIAGWGSAWRFQVR